MIDKLLVRLAAAQSTQEKYWLMTEAVLAQQHPILAELVIACAVVEYFDHDFVRYFLPDDKKSESESWFRLLVGLSFVESYPGDRKNIHELTRNAILWHLQTQEADRLRVLKTRVAAYFTQPYGSAYPADAEVRELGNQFDSQRNAARYFANMAEVEAFLNQHTQAHDLYQQALALYQHVEDRLGEANCLKGLAAVEAVLKQYSQAQAHYQQALALYHRIEDRAGEANCLKGLADVAIAENNIDIGMAGYDRALQIYLDEVGDRQSAARCLLAWAEALILQGNPEMAQAKHDAAVIHAEATGDRWTRAQLWRVLGDIQRTRGGIAVARQAYETARVLAQTIAGTGWWLSSIDARLQALDEIPS